MPTQALGDLKVLDLTHYVAGPYCTKLLADYGADVIKVERPGSGDGARSIGPFLNDLPHPEKSGLFLNLNTNKRSVTLDLKIRRGADLLKELVKWADLLVENFRPSVMPGLGLDYETLADINPRLVMTSISNFGQTSPYRDYKSQEIVTYAFSGLMYASGIPEREPMKLGGNVIQYHTGSTATLYSLLALHAVDIRGRGDHIDLSIADVQTGSVDRSGPMLLAHQYTGELFGRGYQQREGGEYIHKCLDGYINITPFGNFVPGALDMIGMPEMKDDPMFDTSRGVLDPEAVDVFNALFDPWLMEHTVEEVWQEAEKAHMLSGPLYTSEQLLQDPNYRGRAYWTDIEHPHGGNLTYPGRPFVMNDSPRTLRRPAPTLGEHNQEVLQGLLGHSREELTGLRRAGVI